MADVESGVCLRYAVHAADFWRASLRVPAVRRVTPIRVFNAYVCCVYRCVGSIYPAMYVRVCLHVRICLWICFLVMRGAKCKPTPGH